MAITQPTGKNIKDGSVQRDDLDVSTVGQAVTRKIIQGTGVTLSSTGADAGTGDVTINAGGGGSVVNGGNAAYTIQAGDGFVYTGTAFTAARTWTLPAASGVSAGKSIEIVDLLGTITATNTLTISRAGSDTINGLTSIVMSAPYCGVRLVSDGVSRWSIVGCNYPLASVASKWVNAISAVGQGSATQPAFSDISGSVAAGQLPNPGASSLGGIQSKAKVTSQWLDSISTSGVPASSQPTTNDLACEASSGSATTGDLGETISGSVASGSGGALSTGVVFNVISISLTAGDWEIFGFGGFAGNAGTIYTDFRAAWSTASNTQPVGQCMRIVVPSTSIGANNVAIALCPRRISLASTTTHYLNILLVFSAGQPTAYGEISARRMR